MFVTICFICIIQTLLENILKVEHPNYEKRELEPGSSLPIAGASDLVQYMIEERLEWGESWWSVDHVSDFPIFHITIILCYINVKSLL